MKRRQTLIFLLLFGLAGGALAAPIFSNGDLVVSRVAEGDRDSFVNVMSDPAIVAQAAGVSNPVEDRKMAAEWFDALVSGGPFHGFKVTTPSGEVMGFFVLEPATPAGWSETSSAILPKFQGKGVASVARRAITKYAFEELNVAGLLSRVQKTNPASIRITEKLGFAKIGETTKDGDEKPNTWWEYRLSKELYAKQQLPEDATGCGSTLGSL